MGNQVRVEASDAEDRRQLACHMIGAPCSVDKAEITDAGLSAFVIERVLRHLGLWDLRPPSQTGRNTTAGRRTRALRRAKATGCAHAEFGLDS